MEIPMYEALLVVSFGGPEKPADVLPFLENVLRGRNVPRERMLEVAGHYDHFGGRSPINDQNRALIAALRELFDREGPGLPIYWGNRNWHPLLPDTLRQMKTDGIKNALGFFTSAYSSYSGCRQYRENISAAREMAGEGAPEIHKLRAFYNHPGFIKAVVDRVGAALASLPEARRAAVPIAFTAHSIPLSMAQTSRYEAQLRESCRLVAEAVGCSSYELVYQSRSGPPSQPWLGPDIINHLRQLHAAGVEDVIVSPIGFVSDHLEILYDLDTEAKALAGQLGLNLVRAETPGVHPEFVAMIRELMLERMDPSLPRRALGRQGPSHDVCAADCCPPPAQVLRPIRISD
ncbi:MAG TPA: ferrochelatase [Bryobacteraceae bacterium]|nr:ferrochelatase [Bryobacteraceae bacterium]